MTITACPPPARGIFDFLYGRCNAPLYRSTGAGGAFPTSDAYAISVYPPQQLRVCVFAGCRMMPALNERALIA